MKSLMAGMLAAACRLAGRRRAGALPAMHDATIHARSGYFVDKQLTPSE
jgi:hypothetical protein